MTSRRICDIIKNAKKQQKGEKMKKERVDLLIIDPQNDFSHPNGSLFVKNADMDMCRLSKMIERLGNKIQNINITLDAHHQICISHPLYWTNSKNEHPNPFTIIEIDDVRTGKWRPIYSTFHRRTLDYVESLEKNGRYKLCIWPEHCLIGSWGQNVVNDLYFYLTQWEKKNRINVNYFVKGTNPFTEHYSPFQADVPDPNDISTQLNRPLIQLIEEGDIILFAGEAKSHCCANAAFDLVKNFSNPDYIKKIYFLEDAMSPVTGFENLGDNFFNEMCKLGANFTTTDKFQI